MAKKNNAMSREMRAIGGIHALEKKRTPPAVGGSDAAAAEAAKKKKPAVAVTENPPDAEEVPEVAPLQTKKRLRTSSGGLPSYRVQESAEERAQGKKPASDPEEFVGLVKVREDRLQEYESSLLDIPTDREKDYFQGLGYDEAFRQMMMSWGVVRNFLNLSFLLNFFSCFSSSLLTWLVFDSSGSGRVG